MNVRMEVSPLPVSRRPRGEVEGPTPERAKLHLGDLYPVIDMCHKCDSPDGEAYMVLVNDEGEVWYVSNRYLQVVHVIPLDSKTEYHYTVDYGEQDVIRPE